MQVAIRPVAGALVIWVSIGLTGCGSFNTMPPSSSTAPGPVAEVPEIKPGLLQGYLSDAEQLDSKAFVLPAPEMTSALQSLDTAWSEKMVKLRGSPRWEVAIRDADLAFPAAADTFACSLGFAVTKEDTPALYILLRRTLTDIGLATYPAKTSYQRQRPFMSNKQPICTPQDEEVLREDGSYPSGHTAVGWGWALILSELAPDRSEQILARGRAFGESRTVCNVHWYSDVVAGRLVGAAAVARLHTNPAFREALEAARSDIGRVRATGKVAPTDCATEAAAVGLAP
jgi:acid phosphatase (class A)